MNSKILSRITNWLKKVGISLILSHWKDVVRNATAIIYGIVLESRKAGEMSDQDVMLIRNQLKRIEKSISLVKVLDAGDNGCVHEMNKGD